MPQLDTTYFFSSFTWLFLFIFLIYIHLIFFIIPKIFKSLFLRKALKTHYTNLILKQKSKNKLNRKKFNLFFKKILQNK